MGHDRDEICDLLFAYAERIDAGDFAGVADLFAGAELRFAGNDQVCRGREEVLQLYETSTRRHEGGTPLTKHLVTNVVVALDDGASTASARSSFTVLQAVPGALALQPIVAGRYDDRFVREQGSWRFSARRVTVELVGELAEHLTFPLEPRPR